MAKRIEKKPDHWSETVGTPDDWDKKNIETLIRNFEKRKFQVEKQVISGKLFIELCVAESKRAHQLDGANAMFNPTGMKSKEIEARVRTSMPIVLQDEILLAYPAMFKDDAQHEWFIKNFPQFRVI